MGNISVVLTRLKAREPREDIDWLTGFKMPSEGKGKVLGNF